MRALHYTSRFLFNQIQGPPLSVYSKLACTTFDEELYVAHGPLEGHFNFQVHFTLIMQHSSRMMLRLSFDWNINHGHKMCYCPPQWGHTLCIESGKSFLTSQRKKSGIQSENKLL